MQPPPPRAAGDARRRPGDAGGVSVEWLAVAALVVVLLAVLGTTQTGNRFGDAYASILCRVTALAGGDGDCASADGPGGGPGGPEVPEGPGGPGGPQPPDGPGGPDTPEGPQAPESPEPPEPEWPDDDADIDDALWLLLEQTEAGREALALAEEWGVEIVFEPGGGSFHSAGDNRITLDSERPLASLFGTFIHEMMHSRYNHEGRRVDPTDSTRDEYVDGKLHEETDATVAQIRAVQEAQEFFGDEFSSHHLQSDYEEIVAADGEQAGWDFINDYFHNDAVTSNTGDQYTDYYERVWENANEDDGGWWPPWG